MNGTVPGKFAAARSAGLTDAVLPVGGELEAGVADALEAPLRVDAAAVSAHHPVHDALVDVCQWTGEEKWRHGSTSGSQKVQRDVPMQACFVGFP